jgi:sugar lactone lactonase YvrE
LSNGRLYADLGKRQPDGICADVEDGLWVCCFNTGEIIRIAASGAITDRILGGTHAISCQLGGPDGRTLFCTVHTGTEKDMEARRRLSAIKTVRVGIPGAVTAP